jgi:hypothetical protein
VHDLTAQELLDVWERGADGSAARGAVELLAAAGLRDGAEAVAALPLGARDGALLTLRERLFGPRFAAQLTCPACATELELDFATADIRAAEAAEGAAGSVQAADGELEFRVPTSADVLAAEAAGTPAGALRVLLERCASLELGADEQRAVADAMAAADPQADVLISSPCPECGSTSTLPLDVPAYLWREIEAWAQRLLLEVSALARAHGWSESETLALSARRRRFYLEAAGW